MDVAPIALDAAAVPMPAAALASAGGFAWWYADLRTDAGDGLVLIWSFGLPFLPGYAAAARVGQAPAARSRPSLNLALYQRGRPDFYLLQEYAADEAGYDATNTAAGWREQWHFAASQLQATLTGDQRQVQVQLDCPVPGSTARLQGEIALQGLCPQLATSLAASPWAQACSPHRWTPLLAAGTGAASIHLGKRRWQVQGRCYHDRNHGSVPLHALGIRQWLWGRLALADADLIYYQLTPDHPGKSTELVLRLDDQGQLAVQSELQVRPRYRRFGRYAMPCHAVVELCAHDRPIYRIAHPHKVDDGPFYLRFLTESSQVASAKGHGAKITGVSEWIRPHRIDHHWQRPFVRMRVDHTSEPGSWLTPLFVGPRQDRGMRLWRSLWPGGASLA